MASWECVPATVPPPKLKQPTPTDHTQVSGKCTEFEKKSYRDRQRIPQVTFLTHFHKAETPLCDIPGTQKSGPLIAAKKVNTYTSSDTHGWNLLNDGSKRDS